MSGLVLSLKADEKFLVNGALVQNGSKRGQIRLPDTAVNVLRLSDCMHPDDVNTPVRGAYYLTQIILSGDVASDTGALDLLARLSKLEKVFVGTSVEQDIIKAMFDAGRGRYYSVLVTLKRVLPIEQQMLVHANAGAQEKPLEKTG